MAREGQQRSGRGSLGQRRGWSMSRRACGPSGSVFGGRLRTGLWCLVAVLAFHAGQPARAQVQGAVRSQEEAFGVLNLPAPAPAAKKPKPEEGKALERWNVLA